MLPQTALRVSSKTKSGIDFLLEKLSRPLVSMLPYSVRIRAEDGLHEVGSIQLGRFWTRSL